MLRENDASRHHPQVLKVSGQTNKDGILSCAAQLDLTSPVLSPSIYISINHMSYRIETVIVHALRFSLCHQFVNTTGKSGSTTCARSGSQGPKSGSRTHDHLTKHGARRQTSLAQQTILLS